MESPTPPTPRSMSDDELNAEVARLQSQPDGLMAAMALIEQQNALRQQDSFAYSQWQLQAQMNAATAPQPVEPEPIVSKPVMPETIEPAPAFVAAEEPSVEIDEVVEPIADSPVIVEPVAPVAQESSVDDIVAALNRNYENANSVNEDALSAQPVLADATDQPEVIPSLGYEPDPIASVSVQAEQAPAESKDSLRESATEVISVARTKTSGALSASWISIAASPLLLVLAAYLKESGASLAQALVLISGLILSASVLAGVGAVAAKRGSSAIGVISRAAFGVWGNVFPAIVILVVKIVWSIALVFISSRILSPLVFNQPWFAGLSMQFVFPAEFTALVLTTLPMIVIASLLAGFGGITMLRAQQLAGIFSLIGIVGIAFYVFTQNSLQDLQLGEMLATAPLLDLAILCFALFGFTVFSQSGDFARKLPVETPGAKVFFLSFISVFFVSLVIAILGVIWVFMAEDSFGLLLTDQLLPTVASAAPVWVFILFVVAVGLSVLQLVANSMYSLAGALSALTGKIPGAIAVLVFAIVVLAGTLASSLLVPTSELLAMTLELLVLVAVPAASYTGIVLADALIRSRDYHEVSLTRDYGFYGRFNFANTIGFVLACSLGFGYLNAAGTLSGWSGYLGELTPAIFEITGANIGIAMAFGFALLFPVLFGIPKIKGQELKLVELDERREELKEYLDAAK